MFTWKRFDKIATSDAGGVSDRPRVVPEALDKRRLQRRHVLADDVGRKFGAQLGDARAGGLADGVIVSPSLRHVEFHEGRNVRRDKSYAGHLRAEKESGRGRVSR